MAILDAAVGWFLPLRLIFRLLLDSRLRGNDRSDASESMAF